MQHLSAGLHADYLHHWYPSDVLRGSAYRALWCDQQLDSRLRRAAELTGIAAAQLDKLLQPARFKVVMYVNPGEVKVHNTALMSSGAETIWQRDTEAAGGEQQQDADRESSPQLLSLDEGQTVTQLLLAGSSPPQHRRAHHAQSVSSHYQPSLYPPSSTSSAAVSSSSAVRSDSHSPSAPLSPASPSSVSGSSALNGADHSMVARVMAAH